MFVRVRHSNDSATLYEADRVRFDSGPGESDSEAHLFIENKGREQHVVVDKAGEEVYVMNHEGQTIEAYRWEPLKE